MCSYSDEYIQCAKMEKKKENQAALRLSQNVLLHINSISRRHGWINDDKLMFLNVHKINNHTETTENSKN